MPNRIIEDSKGIHAHEAILLKNEKLGYIK